ncbi:hypothetical protein HYT23_05920 [Candidatus Pacearchaeota archaeon]|nr:hypothetical protein [Candidatus Pacearchaeota archaeon]
MDPIIFNYAIEGTTWVLIGAGYYVSRKIKEAFPIKKDGKLAELVKSVEVKRD